MALRQIVEQGCVLRPPHARRVRSPAFLWRPAAVVRPMTRRALLEYTGGDAVHRRRRRARSRRLPLVTLNITLACAATLDGVPVLEV